MKYIWRIFLTLFITFIYYPFAIFLHTVFYIVKCLWEFKLINYKEVFEKDMFYLQTNKFYHVNRKSGDVKLYYEVYKNPKDVLLMKESTVDSEYNDVDENKEFDLLDID